MIAAIMLTYTLATAQPQRSLLDRRLDAIAQLESNDRDYVTGTSGEKGRYQIAPTTWREYARFVPFARATDPSISREVARQILTSRIKRFMRTHRCAPNEVQVYCLYHKPRRIDHPNRRTREMAQRFANLVTTP